MGFTARRGLLALGVVAMSLLVTVLSGCGGSDAAQVDGGPVHVHGLGINPADGALFIATHTGLFRSPEGDDRASRVGDSQQDTMGFAVAGEDRFLGSGHPDLREDLPPLLGLIESRDAGRSWQSISLSGEADFHVLRSAGETVYGYDASNDRLLTSSDGGRTWSEVERPVPLADLVVDPGDSEHLIASGAGDLEQGLYESRDGGRSWRRVGDAVALLAWPAARRLYLLDGSGRVSLSTDGGTLEARGTIGGEPAAFLDAGPGELYAALHDGTVKRSADGGATWVVRSAP